VKKHCGPKWYGENEMYEPMMGMKNKKCMPEEEMCQSAMGMKHKHKKCMGESVMCEPMMGMKDKMCTDPPPMDGMTEMSEMCGCKMGKMDCMQGMNMETMLAHAYVPMQYYEKAFCPQEALQKGTLFPELYGPYPTPE